MKALVPGPIKDIIKGCFFRYRLLTVSKRMLPGFIIIGGQRCGSTSLYRLLVQHPRVRSAFKKEVHFFSFYVNKGLNWYKAHFPLQGTISEEGERIITGEATPYYMFHPAVARRVYETIPDIKLLVILRNPVDRAYSHYQHEVRKGREEESFEEAIRLESKRLEGEKEKLLNVSGYYSFNHHRHSYLSRGLYSEQLKEWLAYFSLDQMFIIDSRELFDSTAETMNQVFRFLGLPEQDITDRRAYNAAKYSPMKPSLEKELADFFKPANEALFDLLGRRFEW